MSSTNFGSLTPWIDVSVQAKTKKQANARSMAETLEIISWDTEEEVLPKKNLGPKKHQQVNKLRNVETIRAWEMKEFDGNE